MIPTLDNDKFSRWHNEVVSQEYNGSDLNIIADCNAKGVRL